MSLIDAQPTTRKPVTRESESQWRELLDAFEASGLSIKQFCLDYKVTLSSFHLWRKKLRAVPQQTFVRLVAPKAESTVRCQTGTKSCLCGCGCVLLPALRLGLKPNVHLHMIVLDGEYTEHDGQG